MQVTHKLFWTRYFFKVHLIELQENRRQILKKRAAEVASKNENEENNWDDVADLADNPTSNTIPAEVQEKLLSEYEKELIGEKYNYANAILFLDNAPLGTLSKRDACHEKSDLFNICTFNTRNPSFVYTRSNIIFVKC